MYTRVLSIHLRELAQYLEVHIRRLFSQSSLVISLVSALRMKFLCTEGTEDMRISEGDKMFNALWFIVGRCIVLAVSGKPFCFRLSKVANRTRLQLPLPEHPISVWPN